MAAVPVSLMVQRALDGGTSLEPLRSGPAPAFSLPALDGTTLSSGELAGRPVVLHFFGTWCEACRDSVEALAAVRSDHPEVAMVGILFRDEPATASRTAADLGLDWPLLVDTDESVARAFGVDSAPVTFFVSPAGEITGRLVGPVSRPLVERQLQRIIAR